MRQKTVKKRSLHHVDLALKILSERESVFSRQEIASTALKMSLGEKGIADVEGEMQSSKEIRSVASNFYTTREIKFIERDIVQRVRQGHGLYEPVSSSFDSEQLKLENVFLSNDQKKAVTHILTSKDQVTGIQGDAGTGKTTMLSVAAAEYRKAGYEVTGLSLTGKAVDELNKAGILSQTIDSFLASEIPASERRALIVDEASLLGSKKFFEILKCAREEDRLILVGDVKQLQSIEAGGIFGKLQEIEAIKTVRMSENIRQRRKHVLETAMELAEKRFAKAFTRLERKERLIEIVNREERIQAVANAFLKSHDKENTLVVVRSNEERMTNKRGNPRRTERKPAIES